MSGPPPYRIEFTRAARKGLEALPARERERRARAIDALATESRPTGARALQGQPGLLHLRVGDYRVVYQVRDDVLTVLVVRIGHRREDCRRG
ncbi:MAG TPA: type II toxin-antitoxin system RelE/ParE family toxin [Dehalococcoidia bacterium]|nr:type II toxin-antitoxin system RelE/ParE family toxin [Dehalococcoidia bacterium]